MSATALPQTRDLALELHELLREIDPARWRPEIEATVRSKLGELDQILVKLMAAIDPRGSFGALHPVLERAHDLIANQLPATGLSPRAAKRAWQALRRQLIAAYDQLSTALTRWDVHVPALRPTNYARNLFHVGWAALATFTLAVYPNQTFLFIIISGFFTWAWTMETLRRFMPKLNDMLLAWLGRFAHPHEWHRVNSATWYATALFVLTYTGVLTAALPALVILGLGDPAAAVVGRRWGTTKLIHGRSLEGSTAFVLAGGLGSFLAMSLVHPQIPTGVAALTCGLAAVVGAIAELLSRKIDDNLSIPLSSAAAATLVLTSFGITP